MKIKKEVLHYIPTQIVFIIFVYVVNFRDDIEYVKSNPLDFVKHVTVIGFCVLGFLILSRIPLKYPKKLKRYILIFQKNATMGLFFFVFLNFVLTDDGQFPEFNFVMFLFVSYLGYVISLCVYQNPIVFKNEFVEKYKRIVFNIIVFFGLNYLSNTTDDRGEFSTRNQFELLTWLFIFKIILTWLFDKWKLIRQLKNEKVEAELSLLKNQVNPHFFFNTLNNLYGLTREKSDKAPEMVLQLSNMMRYTIYKGSGSEVLLSDEVEYIENFIMLHKMRYHKDIEVKFKKNIDSDDYKISPLLFINSVENAFKHGVEHLRTNSFVHINLSVIEYNLKFEVENNFDPEEIGKNDGIGLKNLKRRLELLYPRKHILENVSIRDLYKVTLEIDLK